ncbi:RINT1-like protein MAG2 [Aristolochia californica]|uniref:RINT1-like protein MAG2 n=1 Tax=Aristolochia californica TaxID=171875 RepID=UPI0035DAD085
MEKTLVLPPFSDLSLYLLSFLGQKFLSREDLLSSSNVVSELQRQCTDLEVGLADLNQRLFISIAVYASRSERATGVLDTIKGELSDLKSSTCVSGVLIDGAEGDEFGGSEQVLAKELPALAKEVSRVETVRAYAETALKLDTLIGDVEDAVSSSMTALRKSSSTPGLEEMRLLAIKSLKHTEDILISITKTRPQWTHLVSAVDHRVDRALAVLRPQAIADHRSLLASLGWPPPLSSSAVEKSSQLLNPLFFMEGDLKDQYRENFLALCHLQELQRCRKSRQLVGHNLKVSLQQPLWAIEELVNPIAVASQRHFSKWIEKPEFIFALVYKITSDFVDSMDELLQPLVDKARLVGYSCREEWVSAVVTSLSTYLAKEIFPTHLAQLSEESTSNLSSQARISWLHLVDLMISFDKRIQSLLTSSGILISVKEEENLRRISAMSVFCDRPDWLEIWAQLELSDTLDKLKPVMEDERNWKMKIDNSVLLSGSEDYKSPAVSAAILRHLSTLVDSCRPLPSIFLRARFIRLAVAPVMQNFIDCLLRRCQEAEGLTALADDDALVKVTSAINAARYCESVLNQWAEDIFFLEMGVDEAGENTVVDPGSFVLQEEIEKLQLFQTEWVEKISTVILRGFDARCRDYLKNKKQWQEKREEGWTVSQTFIGALDYLQAKILKLEGGINEIDFLRLWRGLASGIDQLIFSGILMGNVKFNDGGVERLNEDLEVLFGVFRAWCLRPEGFFPKVSQGLKLLKMKDKKVKEGFERGKERWLRENMIRHLSISEAEKIIKNRVFGS